MPAPTVWSSGPLVKNVGSVYMDRITSKDFLDRPNFCKAMIMALWSVKGLLPVQKEIT